jgi:hypothetical protein
VRGRAPVRATRSASCSGECDTRVANAMFCDPPSAFIPTATARPSTSVDLPAPFSPTSSVTRGSNSSGSRSARTAGSVNGHIDGSSTRSSSSCTDRRNGMAVSVRPDVAYDPWYFRW